MLSMKKNKEWQKSKGRIIKANLSWNPTRAKFCQLIASLSLILIYSSLNWQNSNLRSLNLTFSAKKKDINPTYLHLTG